MSVTTFKEHIQWCGYCSTKHKILCWSYDPPTDCPDCGLEMFFHEDTLGQAPGVISDELHGYAAKHGVCNPDGTARKFYSKTDLKRALNEAGLTIDGDTPKPYRV